MGATHGAVRRGCAAPSGSNVFCALSRGLTPTAIHVLSLRDNGTGYVLPPTKSKSEPVPFNQDEFKNDPLIQKALEVVQRADCRGKNIANQTVFNRMPEFIAQCPTCGFSFSTDESSAGVTTTCASCSKDFIPQQSSEPIPQNRAHHSRPDQILVTSGDLHVPYEIVGMVCFTVGTRGEMRSTFETLKTGIAYKLGKLKGQVSQAKGVGQFRRVFESMTSVAG